VLARLWRIDADAMREFSRRVASGADLPSDDPVLLLRRRLIQQKYDKYRLKNDELAAFIIKAWNAYRTGASLNVLRWVRGGQNPEAFPVPL